MFCSLAAFAESNWLPKRKLGTVFHLWSLANRHGKQILTCGWRKEKKKKTNNNMGRDFIRSCVLGAKAHLQSPTPVKKLRIVTADKGLQDPVQRGNPVMSSAKATILRSVPEVIPSRNTRTFPRVCVEFCREKGCGPGPVAKLVSRFWLG